jgi:hypothetical protein
MVGRRWVAQGGRGGSRQGRHGHTSQGSEPEKCSCSTTDATHSVLRGEGSYLCYGVARHDRHSNATSADSISAAAATASYIISWFLAHSAQLVGELLASPSSASTGDGRRRAQGFRCHNEPRGLVMLLWFLPAAFAGEAAPAIRHSGDFSDVEHGGRD